MPVIDRPVHEKVKITADKPYGCSNAKRSHGYWTYQREYFPDGNFMMTYKYFADVMSTKCRHDKRNEDPRCKECKKESDIEWLSSYGL